MVWRSTWSAWLLLATITMATGMTVDAAGILTKPRCLLTMTMRLHTRIRIRTLTRTVKTAIRMNIRMNIRMITSTSTLADMRIMTTIIHIHMTTKT